MAAKLDAATLRRLAVRASVDPKTIAKVFRGERVRGLAFHSLRSRRSVFARRRNFAC